MAKNKNDLILSTAAKLSRGCDGFHSDMPRKDAVRAIIRDVRALLFPEYFRSDGKFNNDATAALSAVYDVLLREVTAALEYAEKAGANNKTRENAEDICGGFISALPEIKEKLYRDIEAGFAGDPAAKSHEDILISYPGMLAVFVYRIAHELYIRNVPLIPRMMTEYAHSRSGIDINAGAKIGEYFFIDHGTGVVIGETTEIGNRVKLYQGVTLGALSTRKGQELSGVKRHPTIGDDVTIYANSTVLGGDTVIGDGCIIGGNAFITKSVPPHTKVIVKNQELIFKGPTGDWEI